MRDPIRFGGDVTDLGDYETGTWTPVLAGTSVAGTQTYANQGGTYIKVGNLVWVTGIVALSALDGATSGAMLITGLPFTGSSGSHNAGAFSIARFANIAIDDANGYYFPTIQNPAGGTTLQLIQFGDNVADKSLLPADFANNSAIRFTGMYPTGTPSAG